MMRLRLVRDELSENGTRGTLQTEAGEHICHTLELPWRNNEPQLSCIPAAPTHFRRRYSPHNKCVVFTATNVPGRTHINIEVANYVRQLLGCIALGTARIDIDKDGIQDVAGSRAAFEAFMARMEGVEEFTLDIVNAAVPAPPLAA